MPDSICIALVTCPPDRAAALADLLVEGRHAACVNIVPNIHSVYRWKGRVCDDGEMLLIIKTRAASFDAVREVIHKVNTYELPEVLAYKVDWASPGFASWIEKMTVVRKAARPAPPRRAAGRKPARRAARPRQRARKSK